MSCGRPSQCDLVTGTQVTQGTQGTQGAQGTAGTAPRNSNITRDREMDNDWLSRYLTTWSATESSSYRKNEQIPFQTIFVRIGYVFVFCLINNCIDNNFKNTLSRT